MRKYLIAFAALASTALSALAANPMVELKTSQGEIVVEVFADKAPKSAENFVSTSRTASTTAPSSTASSTASWSRAAVSMPR